MRYQIYEAKSVKYDAQQRVGIIPERLKSLEMLDFCVTELPRDNKMTTF